MTMGLAAQQAGLLAALVSGADVPPGFDAARIRAAARGLAVKRKNAVHDTWPDLAGALASQFDTHFDTYAESNVLPATGNAQLDGWLFCVWLKARDVFPPAAWPERMRFALRFRIVGSRVLARSGPKIALGRNAYGGWLLAMRLPSLGEFWLGHRQRGDDPA